MNKYIDEKNTSIWKIHIDSKIYAKGVSIMWPNSDDHKTDTSNQASMFNMRAVSWKHLNKKP
jgi:hypothetical protein